MTSSVRAEIQNDRTCCFLDTFNFSSATKVHFPNVNILLTSVATWSKGLLIDGLVTELLREMCTGDCFSLILAPYLASIVELVTNFNLY